MGEVGCEGEFCQILRVWQQFSLPLIFGHCRRNLLIFNAQKTSLASEKFFSPPEKVVSSLEKVLSTVEQLVSSFEKSVSSLEEIVSGVEQVVPALGTIVSSLGESVSNGEKTIFLIKKMNFVKKIWMSALPQNFPVPSGKSRL